MDVQIDIQVIVTYKLAEVRVTVVQLYVQYDPQLNKAVPRNGDRPVEKLVIDEVQPLVYSQ